MSNLYSGVKWYAAVGGTGNLIVGAPARGCITPAKAGVPNGTSNISYKAFSGVQSEWGLGTYDNGVFVRNTVLGNSLGTTELIDFFPPPIVSFEDVQPTDISAGDGGSAGPFPFFGQTGTAKAWSRPSLSAFTEWLNQTDSTSSNPQTATATDNTGGLPLVIQSGMDSTNLCLTGLLKPMGPPPWTVSVGFAGMSNAASGAVWTPLIAYNSNSGKAEALWWPYFDFNIGGEGANALGVTAVGQYSSTSPSGTPPSFPSSEQYGSTFLDYFGWFQIENDGTNLTYSISAEGILYMPVYTETLASFMSSITHLGFGYDRGASVINGQLPSGGPSPQIAALLWNWVED